MFRLLATPAALLLSFAVFAQGSGLKPSTSLEKIPATENKPAPPAGQAPVTTPEEPNPGVKAVEEIFECLAAGLTNDWRSATVEVIEIGSSSNERQFEARYTFTEASDATPRRLLPCDATSPAKRVHALNDFLEPEKRQWKRALLKFSSDGKFELKYDYTE